MRELRVDSNQLSGAFPDICLPNSVNPLTHIYASNNKFTGNVKLGQCRSLVTVDVTANNIVGIESSALSWYLGGARSLRSFSIGGNNLSSLVISGLPANSFIYLTKLDLYGCSLQGTFPTEFARLSYLSYLNFAGNELTGTLPDWMFDNTGMLVHMVGSDNNFNGSIPAPGYSTMLTSLSFSNNQLTGTIPEDIASLLARAPDAELALGYNLMSCCGRGYVGRNTSADEAAFGERGFQAVYSYFDWSAPKIPDSVEFSTNYARQYFIDMHKRRRKAPKAGDVVSIVVTDIEGFSDLMKADPENTTKALLLHNNVIGRAKHDSFGYTIEQA
ncbi:hypothetical protein FOA52_001055 [Chlamydomonas sp. UWO 241]|nr:hypothetical protein FOA52_001055 [Chlamydomonas sp. UWO 241]